MNKALIFFFLLVLAASGCKKANDTDNCVGVNCGAHGNCVDGACNCELYWTKDASGRCTVYDCGVNGSFNSATSTCECNAGWSRDLNGRCTLQDLCYQVDCGTNGDCDPLSGNCECDPGYTTDADGKCNVELRAQLIGTWRGSHTDDFGNSTGPYLITITAVSGNMMRVKISNFMNYYCNPLAQNLDVYGEVTTYGNGIDDFISLCSQWNTSGTFDSANLIDPNTLNIRVFITTGGGGGLNLNGTYFKQP